MKKSIKVLLFILIAIFTFTFISSNKVSADTGPKSSINITILGDTKGLYMTLLSKTDSTGPWYIDRPSQDEIDLKFKSYVDKDNFYYLGFNKNIETGSFTWGYYPPDTFKILIYDEINDKFITDDKTYDCYAFNSEFKLTLNDISFTVEKNKTIISELLNLLLRIVICIIIELLVALIFSFEKQELLLIALVNLITQLILNTLLNLVIYFNGFNILLIVPYYIVSEMVVLLLEVSLYYIFMPKIDKKYNIESKNSSAILGYTLLANFLSLALGFVVLSFVPGMK